MNKLPERIYAQRAFRLWSATPGDSPRNRTLFYREDVVEKMLASRPPFDEIPSGFPPDPVTGAVAMEAEPVAGDFDKAFQLIFEAYSCPADRFEADAGYIGYLRGRIRAAITEGGKAQ